MHIAQSHFRKVRVLVGIASLCLIFYLGHFVGAQQEPQQLRVIPASGPEMQYDVETLGSDYYLSRLNTTNLLKNIEPTSRISWDAAAGALRIEAEDKTFSLSRQDNILIYNNSMIETPGRLVAARGQVFVPLSSLYEILRRMGGLRSNITEFLTDSTSPDADGGDDADDFDPAFSGNTSRIDIGSVIESLALITGEKAPQQSEFSAQLRLSAEPLLERRTIVIDPQPRQIRIRHEGDAGLTRPGTSSDPGPDLTLKIAKRCREMLERHENIKIVLTRENQYESPPLEDRLRVINASKARALFCLRLDYSAVESNRGFRIYSVHRAIDPSARAYFSARRETPGTLPLDVQYTPYENLSLILAQLADDELRRAGLNPGEEKIKLAPFFLLKRAAMPSVSLSLGYSSNPDDRQNFSDPVYVDSAAASLAQSILAYNRWLEQLGLEANY
ncbi:MAG: N-acetylmuramoyl-L-alanine amidase [Candidatus Sumerlaeia bacterium]